MTDDPKQFSETVSTPVHDPDALERAGWTNAEVIWEQVQQAAEECDRAGDRAEAVELWRGAFDVACEHLDPRDLRLATSAANLGVAARRAGDRAAAVRRLDEALRLWDEGEGGLPGRGGGPRGGGGRAAGMRERSGSRRSCPPRGREARRSTCDSSPGIPAPTTDSRANASGRSRGRGGRSLPPDATAGRIRTIGSRGGGRSARRVSTTGAGCSLRCSSSRGTIGSSRPDPRPDCPGSDDRGAAGRKSPAFRDRPFVPRRPGLAPGLDPPAREAARIACRRGRVRGGSRGVTHRLPLRAGTYRVSMNVSRESSRASHQAVWWSGARLPVTGDRCAWSR